ncbi:hypothetical protein CBM2626_A10124 [Cupriavidus taiwanensis]|nr:hypothetical protein CBM2626_A10124 [Cupriavidus taiwanensis]
MIIPFLAQDRQRLSAAPTGEPALMTYGRKFETPLHCSDRTTVANLYRRQHDGRPGLTA